MRIPAEQIAGQAFHSVVIPPPFVQQMRPVQGRIYTLARNILAWEQAKIKSEPVLGLFLSPTSSRNVLLSDPILNLFLPRPLPATFALIKNRTRF